MGITVKRSCPKCTYQRIFEEGVGIRARNLSMIRKVFPKEELVQFDKALEKTKKVSYELNQKTGFCETCKELATTYELRYSEDGLTFITIQKGCPKCEKLLVFQGKENSCPKCGTKLNVQTIGFWD